MTEFDALFGSDPPGLYLIAIEDSPLADLIIDWTREHTDCAIRRVRGQKATDDRKYFDEISAAWQFPYYFGENWDAFWECITDLRWIPQKRFLVVVERADLLLRDSERGFSVLMGMFSKANECWRVQRAKITGQMEMEPIPFQVLLACSSGTLAALSNRVEATGVPFVLL